MVGWRIGCVGRLVGWLVFGFLVGWLVVLWLVSWLLVYKISTEASHLQRSI